MIDVLYEIIKPLEKAGVYYTYENLLTDEEPPEIIHTAFKRVSFSYRDIRFLRIVVGTGLKYQNQHYINNIRDEVVRYFRYSIPTFFICCKLNKKESKCQN